MKYLYCKYQKEPIAIIASGKKSETISFFILTKNNLLWLFVVNVAPKS